MEKIKMGIIAIFVIFMIGGCYAVYHGNDLANNGATDISSSPNRANVPSNDINNQSNNLQNDNINTIKDFSQNNNINKFASALEITYRQIPGVDVLVNKDVDYTDRYLHCVACGGFIALGEVTKALPEDALCPDLCGGHSINNNTDYSVTYEYAKAFYDKHGRHPEEIVEETAHEEIRHVDVPPISDEPIAIYDMNNPNQFYESNTPNPIEPIAIYDMNNPNEQP